MIKNREDLHHTLVSILGSNHVYFQPPENIKMVYPAIVYERADIRNRPADNLPYKLDEMFQITVIDKNPDSEYVYRIAQLPRCRFDRHFTHDNLNHDVFIIY